MNKTQEKLHEMTKKFLSDLRSFESMEELPDSVEKNFNAYLDDAEHFLSEGDYVRAFESVVYASGLKDSCTRLTES